MQSLAIITAVILGLWACVGEEKSATKSNMKPEKYYVAGLAEPTKGRYVDDEGIERGEKILYFYAELVFHNGELKTLNLKDSSDPNKCRHFDDVERDVNDWLITTNFQEGYDLYIDVSFNEGDQISDGLFQLTLFRFYEKKQIADYKFTNGIHAAAEKSNTVVYKTKKNTMDKKNMQKDKIITLKEVMSKFGDGSGCAEQT